MSEMQVAYVKVGNVIPYRRNPRRNEAAVQVVAESIKRFGFQQPICLDEDNIVLAGHTRLLAAKRLGLDTVPCVYARGLSDKQKKAYRLADNKTHEFSLWNMDLLQGELADLSDFKMEAFGFSLPTDKATAVIEEVEVNPYRKAHHLVTIDVAYHDKIVDLIEELRKVDGVEIVSMNN